MKNKGRKHKHVSRVNETGMAGAWNVGGTMVHVTRPIESMSRKGFAMGSFDKKKWQKRVRGYFKSQTKDPIFGVE